MFDSILSPRATQQDVYNEAVRPIVDDVLLGYNGSVMAYGQTGAGKTYTLSNMDPDAIGMTPRALADIFNKASQDVACTYNVFMSYVRLFSHSPDPEPTQQVTDTVIHPLSYARICPKHVTRHLVMS